MNTPSYGVFLRLLRLDNAGQPYETSMRVMYLTAGNRYMLRRYNQDGKATTQYALIAAKDIHPDNTIPPNAAIEWIG